MARGPLSLVDLAVVDGVALLTINRPAALNSINPAVVHQLEQALEQAVADTTVRGIVLSGAGKAFVVGADIDFFVRNIDAGDIARIIKFTEAAQRLVTAIDDCPKTVVARVDGAALGAGTEIALACDYVIATPRASFGLPETSLGIYPGLGGTQRTSRRLGVGIAKWMIYTGKIISASDAWRIGLVDRVVTGEQLDSFCIDLAAARATCHERPPKTPQLDVLEQFFAQVRVDDLLAGSADLGGDAMLARVAQQVAAKPSLALRLAEELVERGAGLGLAAGLQLELAHLGEVFASPEAQSLLRLRRSQRLGDLRSRENPQNLP